jgi:hypothetical protein
MYQEKRRRKKEEFLPPEILEIRRLVRRFAERQYIASRF